MGLSHLWYYYWHQKSGKYLLALGVFYGMRAVVQNNFIMGRVEGYAWWNPEFLSIIVPYHDVNDFYYSGHIGFSTIHLLQDVAERNLPLGFVSLFIWIN